MDDSSAASSSTTAGVATTTHERIYVAWINSQLRKVGTLQIRKLQECADGIALASLMEVLGGEPLNVTDNANAPQDDKSTKELNDNSDLKKDTDAGKRVDAVLNAIRRRQIRMGTVSSADIVKGDQRAIMRVVLALAAHFKPTTSRSQQNLAFILASSASNQPAKQLNNRTVTDTVSSNGNSKRERTWQNLKDSTQTNVSTLQRSSKRNDEVRRNDDEPVSKRGDYDVAALTEKFERSFTFDSANSLHNYSASKARTPKGGVDSQGGANGESTDNPDTLFSFSQYAKMSDAEKLSSATRRGATKRQEWLEQRRRRAAPAAANHSGSESTSQALQLAIDDKVQVGDNLLKQIQSANHLDHSSALKANHARDFSDPPKDLHKVEIDKQSTEKTPELRKPAKQQGDETHHNVHDPRDLLSKLQCTLLLNRLLDESEPVSSWTSESTNDLIESVLADDINSGESDVEKPLSTADVEVDPDADCVILRSRLDVALAKQRELARRLQHARLVNANLMKANASLRDRLAENDTNGEGGANVSSQRITNLEAEVFRLRAELEERNRIIGEFTAGRSDQTDGCVAQDSKKVEKLELEKPVLPLNTNETLNLTVASANEDVDELSEMTSRTLSAYSPSHDTAARASFCFDDFEPSTLNSSAKADRSTSVRGATPQRQPSAAPVSVPNSQASPNSQTQKSNQVTSATSRIATAQVGSRNAKAASAFRGDKKATGQSEEEDIL